MPPPFFDAHLDLSYLALLGREMAAPADTQRVPHPPAAVTLDSLRAGGVAACLGTIFTEADGDDEAISYPAGDADAAMSAGLRQLECYQDWKNTGLIRLFDRAEESDDESRTTPAAADAPTSLGILIEGGDPIRAPEDAAIWQRWGVVAVGMAWWKPSRYAGGNGTDLGLSGLGRELARAMDECGLVHDLSHLSQRATDDLLALTDAVVIASHSNCRALLDGVNQRHLADETIREIGRRGGVVGINLVSGFLRVGHDPASGEPRATVDDVCDHVERVCDLMGHRRGVGLGSDMDGGFPATWLPDGIDSPGDLTRITDALTGRGFSDEDVRAFAWDNWADFWMGRGLSVV